MTIKIRVRGKSRLTISGFAVLFLLCFNLEAFEKINQDHVEHAPGAQHAIQSGNTVSFEFAFPDIDMVDHRNHRLNLAQLFDERNNVVFAFFFTHCISVCTTITHTLKNIQPDLPAGTRIAMISIDPETDTPDLLSRYAETNRIDGANWYFLTGELRQIIDLQKQFEAYRGNKMNHSTSLFVKKSNSTVITEFKSGFSEIPEILSNT